MHAHNFANGVREAGEKWDKIKANVVLDNT